MCEFKAIGLDKITEEVSSDGEKDHKLSAAPETPR